MSAHCCDHGHENANAAAASPVYRRILWVALAVNLAMFAVEIGAGLAAQSSSLLADSLDFLGDSANYGLSLFVLGMALHWRARASLIKAASMAAFGLWVAYITIGHALAGTVPSAPVMGAVGALAFAANLGVAFLLYRWREGDSNMRSVWLCTRNDAIGNLAVLVAAAGVFGSGTGWPDYAVAAIISGLALTGAFQVARHALGELREPQAVGSL
ncbi:MAG: cation transporter [Reyranella sp.]|uniref:cation transporter n=1 Tax=Reyranella sp. TaxID=1929291 RepID=UPI00272F613C|nr:cation transporter [Reyranella sp.]MDP1964491.1 cation transporter [Reyranella sp.]MDP2373937.1 cation transporter [Reyranella sp.]